MRYAAAFAVTSLAVAAMAVPTGWNSCQQCNPTPGQGAKCDITTSCIRFVTSNKHPKPHFCACRHGYKADNHWAFQFRTTWSGQEGRVFVPPGVSCNTLCNNPLTCDEVPIRDQCWKNPWGPHTPPYTPPYTPKPYDNGYGHDNYGQKDDGYGQKDDGYGQKDDGYGQKDDGYGQKDDSYGHKDDSYGRKDDNYGYKDNNYGHKDNNYGGDNNYGQKDNNYGGDNYGTDNYGGDSYYPADTSTPSILPAASPDAGDASTDTPTPVVAAAPPPSDTNTTSDTPSVFTDAPADDTTGGDDSASS